MDQADIDDARQQEGVDTVVAALKRHRFAPVPLPGQMTFARGRATGTRWHAILEPNGTLTVYKGSDRYPSRDGTLANATSLSFDKVDAFIHQVLRS